ncbi:MAG TPA: zf-HC2 domain-containing protein, partial [bacterium]
MNIKCISSQQIINYHDGQLKKKERRVIMIHLAQCDICLKNLARLKEIDRHFSFESQKKITAEHKKMIDRKCINDIELYDYLEGRLTNEEARSIEVHLNSCYTCFESFASLLRNSLTGATPDEATEISAMRNITVEEQVDKIVSILDKECPQKSKRVPRITITIIKWWEKIKSIFENSIFVNKRWRWATAFACILLLIGLIGYP